ncbi:MAG: phosphoribosylamine--glycine ligase [Nanoarchaeota archaeon]|nr:phosphoribosylamine--glycine ligase [Nanoarchaeota archaeon]
MKILVLGSGGREHALCWKISQDKTIEKIFCVPGNSGTSLVAENIGLDIMDNEEIINFVKQNNIDLTLAGPEAPLVNGIVDEFEKNNLRIFGPKRFAANLEGSKVFSKKMLWKYNIPTAKGEIFDDAEKAIQFVKDNSWARIVKADGLAAGKGVYVCKTEEEAVKAIKEIMHAKIFGDAGNSVVIEERLVGEEASFLVFSDGKTAKAMVSTQDHKPAYDNDEGPNTGGMGAYGPAPVITKKLHENAMQNIMLPIIRAMEKEGTPYKGVLYGGLMITEKGPLVIEFNCRFGDPECQPIMMLMATDLIPVLEACIDETLDETEVIFRDMASCCVVLASGGYPGKYEKDKPITGLKKAGNVPDVMVFHAGAKNHEDGIFTNGGRVLGVTGIGKNIRQAIDRSYEAARLINFENMHYRKDIGAKALNRS